jgi:hypothetical protein
MRRFSIWVLLAAACGGSGDDDEASGDIDGGVGDDDAGGDLDGSPGQRPPTVEALTIEVEVGGSATAALAASDPEGDPLTWTIVSPPIAGEIDALDTATGVFTYRTDSLVSGSDAFAVTVTDGSTEPVNATVTVAIVPFVFTGDWALGAVTNGASNCTGSSVRIAHGPQHLDIGSRVIQCGATTYDFDPVYAAVDGDDLFVNGVDVGDLGDATLTMTRSMVVSGCGTVTTQLAIEKTADGYTYAESASVPCGPDPDMEAAPTYAPIALVEYLPDTHSLGSVEPDQTAAATVTMMNIGKLPAGSLSAVSSDPMFAFAGGAWPGTGGTCGADLAGRASCQLALVGSGASPGSYRGWLTTSYHDGAGDRTAYGNLTLHIVPALRAPSAIAAANNAFCALDGGSVICWGSEAYGQTDVPALTAPIAVDVGNAHACAIAAAGVECWGDGSVAPPPLTSPSVISTGDAHTCALHEGGVACWGDNSRGQSTVPPLSNPVAVTAGGYHTCAIDDTGVHCWGWNNQGQTAVPALANPVAVSAGSWHTCAIDDGGVRCWGRNYDRESTVPPLSSPTMVSAGQYRTCAADASGIHCWGHDIGGVGFEPALSAPTALATEWDSACAIAAGALRCW